MESFSTGSAQQHTIPLVSESIPKQRLRRLPSFDRANSHGPLPTWVHDLTPAFSHLWFLLTVAKVKFINVKVHLWNHCLSKINVVQLWHLFDTLEELKIVIWRSENRAYHSWWGWEKSSPWNPGRPCYKAPACMNQQLPCVPGSFLLPLPKGCLEVTSCNVTVPLTEHLAHSWQSANISCSLSCPGPALPHLFGNVHSQVSPINMQGIRIGSEALGDARVFTHA